jgi:hypothetical protein
MQSKGGSKNSLPGEGQREKGLRLEKTFKYSG